MSGLLIEARRFVETHKAPIQTRTIDDFAVEFEQRSARAVTIGFGRRCTQPNLWIVGFTQFYAPVDHLIAAKADSDSGRIIQYQHPKVTTWLRDEATFSSPFNPYDASEIERAREEILRENEDAGLMAFMEGLKLASNIQDRLPGVMVNFTNGKSILTEEGIRLTQERAQDRGLTAWNP